MSRSVSPSPFTLHLSASLRYFKGLPCDVLRLWFCRRCHLNSCADSSGWIFSLCFHEWLPDLEAVKNWHISWHGPALLWHMLTQQCQALSPMCKRIVNTSTYVWYSTLPAIKQWHHYGPSVVTTPKEPKEINGPQAISNYQINKKKANGGCRTATMRDEVHREQLDLFNKTPDIHTELIKLQWRC